MGRVFYKAPELVECSLQGALVEAKNGDELFREEKFMEPMGRPKPPLKVPCLYSF
jgi:hypothetical protein